MAGRYCHLPAGATERSVLAEAQADDRSALLASALTSNLERSRARASRAVPALRRRRSNLVGLDTRVTLEQLG